jgi:hypothetical protein
MLLETAVNTKKSDWSPLEFTTLHPGTAQLNKKYGVAIKIIAYAGNQFYLNRPGWWAITFCGVRTLDKMAQTVYGETPKRAEWELAGRVQRYCEYVEEWSE